MKKRIRFMNRPIVKNTVQYIKAACFFLTLPLMVVAVYFDWYIVYGISLAVFLFALGDRPSNPFW